jgi:putative ABC transport system permease protein
MTFTQLVLKNTFRTPLRTGVTVIAVAMAFIVFGCITSFMAGAHSAENGSMNRLVVASKTGGAQPLPLSHVTAIAALPNVAAVSHTTRIATFSGFERNFVPSSAVDPVMAHEVFGDDLALTPAMMAAFTATPDAVLVGRSQAMVQNWKVGDRINLTSRLYRNDTGSRDWSFVIAGIFDGRTVGTDTHYVVAQYDYLNSLRNRNIDTVDTVVVQPMPGVSPADLAPQIDAFFANSAAPTRTQTERQFLEAFMAQIADIRSIVTSVVLVALLTVLLIVTNTMAAAVRERQFEIGLFKAMGMTQNRIVTLILSETAFVYGIGAMIGCVASYVIVSGSDPATGMVFNWIVAAKILGLGVVLAVLSGLLPSLSALRISPVKTLQSR